VLCCPPDAPPSSTAHLCLDKVPLPRSLLSSLIAMEMHNSFEKQNSIHRDAICFRTLSGYIPSLLNTVPCDSKRVAMCLHRKRAEVINFSSIPTLLPTLRPINQQRTTQTDTNMRAKR
jgi:hypothetical protein